MPHAHRVPTVGKEGTWQGHSKRTGAHGDKVATEKAGHAFLGNSLANHVNGALVDFGYAGALELQGALRWEAAHPPPGHPR